MTWKFRVRVQFVYSTVYIVAYKLIFSGWGSLFPEKRGTERKKKTIFCFPALGSLKPL